MHYAASSSLKSLSDHDIDELTAHCRAADPQAEPLTAEHIRSPDAGLPPVQLCQIGEAQNINALVEAQRLGFLTTGITIVYGDNGSGKSGYVRVLKRACRARGREARDSEEHL